MINRPLTWTRARLLAGFLLIVPAASALAADPPVDAALKEKGLRRSGTAYLLPAEAEVQKQLNRARQLYAAAEAAASRKAEFERGIEAQMQEAEQNLLLLNQRLGQGQGQLSAQEYNQIVGTINTLNVRLGQMKRQASDENRQATGARLASNREDFLQAVINLRKLVDTTNKNYEGLNADAAVKAAIEGLNAAGKAKLKYALGPSKTYLANVATLEKVEATVMSEDVAIRKEGGVYWVDATFNGKFTKPMVFDTGASSVVLPADFALSIGLKPGPDDPVVTAQVADGSEVKAHKMVIPSLRVGKFTVANVECIVMPAEKKNVPPLLGQSFQKNFSIKLNVGAGKLVLSRIDQGEDVASSAAPKAKAKSSARTKKGKRATRAGDDAGPGN